MSLNYRVLHGTSKDNEETLSTMLVYLRNEQTARMLRLNLKKQFPLSTHLPTITVYM